jgi:hypothetical protein
MCGKLRTVCKTKYVIQDLRELDDLYRALKKAILFSSGRSVFEISLKAKQPSCSVKEVTNLIKMSVEVS